MRGQVWRALVVALTLLCGLVGTAAAQDRLRVVPFAADGTLVVNVQLPDGVPPTVQEAIASGLRTVLTYTVELRTVVPAWVDRTITTATVTLGDHYDNLTRRHTLTRVVDGRTDTTVVTDDPAAAQAWMTRLTRLPLIRTAQLDQTRDYYVRVSADARPRGGSLLSLMRPASGQAQFVLPR